ncbi:NAD-dependent epimerase/dehydratase family protein [Pengzhenrongella sicca]|uniref:NAD-dependent epimerase/dehydratase family protein n=1 Tax=Pengzhenrongella sicca TaxID=2819238 RepID=A0A8A4Z8R8_9MICO|nr:NAD-dependent epimerase/dehydratase family protein [Pengzhenrongella sicca]QTE27865.1 NAD-dependent epimerase/dehydratase family protein [Pengzhenrongella sicca]
MRVAVVGASGNVGTALLRAFAADPTITSVVGLARRPPAPEVVAARTLPAPYDAASWLRCDIAAPGPDDRAIELLARAMAGADAVVHAAWAVVPSHNRAAQRRTNVLGARRVVAAALRAGVPQLVVASSVGAYSPSPDDTPRPERWPTGGVRGSAHSADKVAVERLLDETEERHPELTIARMRSALVVQRVAGRQLTRTVLGPLLPARGLTELRVLPWPAGLRVQAVHADDLAAAYREVIVRRQRGPFNVAADDVLHAGDVAAIVAGGRHRDLPFALVRAAVSGAWHARVLPVSPGWLDLAAGVPVLDCARARELLGWRPRRTSAEAVAELVAGIAAGCGTSSPPLRPRRGVHPDAG